MRPGESMGLAATTWKIPNNSILQTHSLCTRVTCLSFLLSKYGLVYFRPYLRETRDFFVLLFGLFTSRARCIDRVSVIITPLDTCVSKVSHITAYIPSTILLSTSTHYSVTAYAYPRPRPFPSILPSRPSLEKLSEDCHMHNTSDQT